MRNFVKPRDIYIYIYNKLVLVILSLNSQIIDSIIESHVERVNENFFKNFDPITD